MPLLTPPFNDNNTNDQTYVIDFQFEELPLVEDDKVAQQHQVHSQDSPSQLQHWHYRPGQLPFKTIKAMAHQGQLPHHLASCKIPQCAAFLYGKATK